MEMQNRGRVILNPPFFCVGGRRQGVSKIFLLTKKEVLIYRFPKFDKEK